MLHAQLQNAELTVTIQSCEAAALEFLEETEVALEAEQLQVERCIAECQVVESRKSKDGAVAARQLCAEVQAARRAYAPLEEALVREQRRGRAEASRLAAEQAQRAKLEAE